MTFWNNRSIIDSPQKVRRTNKLDKNKLDLTEYERKVLSALRDPEKGPALYDIMNKK